MGLLAEGDLSAVKEMSDELIGFNSMLTGHDYGRVGNYDGLPAGVRVSLSRKRCSNQLRREDGS